MLKTKINDIEIWYDNSIDIDKIKTIIMNNYGLVCHFLDEDIISLIPTDLDVLYIPDFEEYFDSIVKLCFDDDEFKKAYSNFSLENAYLAFLVKDFYSDEDITCKKNNISDKRLENIFNYIISFSYYQEVGTFNDYLDYLKYRKEDMVKIFQWLKNKVRYNAYNIVVENIVNKIKGDTYFYDNLDKILDIIYKQIIDKDVSIDKKFNLPNVSVDKIDELFIRFLNYINAPKEWFDKYYKLKEKNFIVYEKTDSMESSMCYKDEGGNVKITIKSDGTIKGFLSLAHEFAHYISWQDSFSLSCLSIQEFPSIFFEKIASVFLSQVGYDKEIISYINNYRGMNNMIMAMNLYPIFSCIINYIKNGKVEKNVEVEKVNTALEKYRMASNRDITLKDLYSIVGMDVSDITVNEFVDQKYDKLTMELLRDGLEIMDGFQYVVGTFLTDELLKKYDASILSKMIMVTSELDNLNLEDVIKLFDLDEIFNEKGLAKKKKI